MNKEVLNCLCHHRKGAMEKWRELEEINQLGLFTYIT
jgi:hypothetical protein